jgi:hypothetical protein
MISLPSEAVLLDHVRASLDAVGKQETQMSTPDWFLRIASEIATRVGSLGMKCHAKGKREESARLTLNKYS